MKKILFGDYILIEIIMILGLAEVMHFGAVFLGWPISRCSLLFAVGLVLLVAASLVMGILCRRKSGKQWSDPENGRGKTLGMKAWKPQGSFPMHVGFALLMVSQLVFLCLGNTIYRNGDMTVETVGSFLVHDGAYRVNPLTGNPYVSGIPLRLEILGLPTLYSMICSLTGCSPVFLVQEVVPVCVLLLSYLAFAILGKVLFGECHRERAVFLMLVALLIWAGTYMYGVDGFNLLLCGWRGVTIRNLVLLPWLFSLCLRKNYFGILLCVVAEICLVWTLYGLGVCLVVAAGMLLVNQFAGRRGHGKESGAGEEEAV